MFKKLVLTEADLAAAPPGTVIGDMVEVPMGKHDLAKIARHIIIRAAGLDPDGKLMPMQPHKTDMQQFNEMLAEGDKHVRDSYLCRALRFM